MPAYVQRLRRDAQRLGDLLEDLGGRLAKAALDLAEVRVRDARQLGELAQRHAAELALLPDELAEVAPAVLELLHRSNDSTEASPVR
jgi:hypothetical protein